MKTTLNEGRIIAAGVGGGLLFTVVPLLGIAVGTEWLSLFLTALSYAVITGVVAFVWPQLSWRTGLWFFASFPLVMLASFLFTGTEAPIRWHAELKSLLEYAPGLVGACFGGWFGAMISKCRGKKLHSVPSSDVR